MTSPAPPDTRRHKKLRSDADAPEIRAYQRELRSVQNAKARKASKPSEETKEALSIALHVSQRGLCCGRCGRYFTWKDDCRWRPDGKMYHSACYWIIERLG